MPAPTPLEPTPRLPRQTAVAVIAASFLVLSLSAAISVLRGPSPPTREATVTEVAKTPNVLLSVRDLARLEGASFHMERVIDMKETQRSVFGFVEAEDSILLIAAGDVVAGVDLAELRDEDVRVDPVNRAVVLELPAPQIFVTSLDSKRTRVWSRRTDLLAVRQEQLESRARAEAQSSLEKGALEAGLLERTRTQISRTVESFVRKLGFSNVEIRFRESTLPSPRT